VSSHDLDQRAWTSHLARAPLPSVAGTGWRRAACALPANWSGASGVLPRTTTRMRSAVRRGWRHLWSGSPVLGDGSHQPNRPPSDGTGWDGP
jgi:hypothetical protein